MAIFNSSIFANIRGSVSGSTYSRNKAGAYVRNKTNPVNPNTASQSDVRGRMISLASQYSGLDNDAVAKWVSFASTYPALNSLGEAYTPSGKQMFIMCNLNLLGLGLGPISEPGGTAAAVPGITTDGYAATLTAVANAITVFTLTGVGSDVATAKIVAQATPPLLAARQSYRNRMRQTGFATQATTLTMTTAFNAIFGTPFAEVGNIVNIRVAAVDVDTGVASAWVYLRGIVA